VKSGKREGFEERGEFKVNVYQTNKIMISTLNYTHALSCINYGEISRRENIRLSLKDGVKTGKRERIVKNMGNYFFYITLISEITIIYNKLNTWNTCI